MSQRRVRLQIRPVGPRPPIHRVAGTGAAPEDSSRAPGADTSPAPNSIQRFVRWYRRADLGKHTAVLAAVVAAASLAITAWGTYKTAQVANDQLTQSREDNEKSERAQASRIAVWVKGAEPTHVVVANRSLDPTWAYVYLGRNMDENPMGIGVIPPCTSMNIPLTTFSERTGEALHPKRGLSSWLSGLAFRDANGRTWFRHASGELDSLDGFEPAIDNKAFANRGTTKWTTEKDVEIKTLSGCSGAG